MTYTTENEKILQEAKHKFAEAVIIFLRFGATRRIVREMANHVVDEFEAQRREGRAKSQIILPEDF